ncbi:MAG: hypothetical protein AB8G23_11435 [Myxococcota bacterium]
MSIVHLDTGNGSGGDGGDSDEALVTALRHRAAEALERAYGFLEAGDDVWAFLRAQVLCGARPASELSDRLAATQQTDGRMAVGTLLSGGGLGFPATDPASLTEAQRGMIGCLEALLIAGDAKILHSSWVEPAVRFLESQQAEDGAFRMGSTESGDVQSELFWTGMIAGILGRTPVSRLVTLEAAGRYLSARFDPEMVEHDGYSALIGYAHFYTNVADDLADEALQWCGRALEKGFRSRHMEAVAAVRVLLTCDAQAMPGATFDVAELLERLLDEQAGDGGFAELCLDGPAGRTTQTVDAMMGIVRLCAALDES